MPATIPHGYHGRLLEIDLSGETCRSTALDPRIVRDYLGGRGLATRIFYERIDPRVAPLGPENCLVLATSPLLGTRAPTSCRGHLVFKSPLTGLLGSSNCGGSWAEVFKRTGHDALVITGAAARPVQIEITPEGAEIRAADQLWGLDVHATTDQLSKPGARILSIGPAGERRVRFAAVMNEKNRAYGRGGAGAVFGSKNLKAIRVSGDRKIALGAPERFAAGQEQAMYLLKAVPTAKRLLRDLGTAGLVRLIDLIDMLPHLNFRDNRHAPDELARVSGEAIRNSILVRAGACQRCPMACQRHTRVGQRVGEGPEYETVTLLGPNCGIYDLPAITLANYRCNELGLDTMSCGGTIACAMELSEAGRIPAEDAGARPLRFGHAEILEELVRQIAYREGIGERLAEGAQRLAQRYGDPAAAMTVKGLEIPGYDPRASYTQALGYMTSPTGACHLRGGYAVSLAFFGGAKEIPRYSLLQSPIAIRNMQNLGIVQDSLGICRFTGFAFGMEPWARMVSGVTGREISTADLEKISDRIAALERMFNLEAGLCAADDTLPARFSDEPLVVAGQERTVSREVISRLRSDYYTLQGWDQAGCPTQATLVKLGVETR